MPMRREPSSRLAPGFSVTFGDESGGPSVRVVAEQPAGKSLGARNDFAQRTDANFAAFEFEDHAPAAFQADRPSHISRQADAT
jgi:hypothetical protein